MKIYRYEQSCFLVELGGLNLYFDPYKISGNPPKADFICISHSHFDHYDKNSIHKILEEQTIIICPSTCVDIVEEWGAMGLKAGEKFEKREINIEAVPAYNVRFLRKLFHPKRKHFLGYVFESEGKRIYHAGDCGLMPEMKGLNEISLAFLPISGWFTMNIKEAVKAVSFINPAYVIPMHERGKSINTFKKLLNDVVPGTKVLLLKSGETIEI